MQVENDYDGEVYKGDIGFVEDVDADAGEPSFDGRAVKYGFGVLEMIVPAYAVTIPKARAPKYPAVVSTRRSRRAS
jgi:exodeoxyribonuclease V alpha subunit